MTKATSTSSEGAGASYQLISTQASSSLLPHAAVVAKLEEAKAEATVCYRTEEPLPTVVEDEAVLVIPDR
jgi:hypothetical protein